MRDGNTLLRKAYQSVSDNRVRTAETVALLATVFAFSVTVVAVRAGTAIERNSVVRTLFDTIGWSATGLLAVAVIAGSFALCRRARNTAPRTILIGSGAIVAVCIGDALYTLSVAMRAEVGPASVEELVPIAVVGGTTVVYLLRPDWYSILSSLRSIRPNSEFITKSAAVFGVSLLLISGVGPFVAFSPVDTAQAAGGDIQWQRTTGTDQYHLMYDENRDAFWMVNETTDTFRAFDSTTGDKVSEITSSDSVSSVGTFAYDPANDIIIAVNSSDHLIGIDADTGSKAWGLRQFDSSQPPDVYAADNGKALAGLTYSDYVVLDPGTGSNITQITETSISGGEYNENNDHFLATDSSNNNVYSIDASTGSTSWSQSYSSAPDDVTAANGTVWMAGSSELLKFDSTDGSQIGSVTTSYDPGGLASKDDKKNISVAGDSGTLERIQPDGTAIWSKSLYSSTQTIALSDGDAVVGSFNGSHLTGVDAGFGGQPVSGTITDSDGVSVADATITVKDGTGSTVKTATTDSTGAYSVTLGDGSYTITASKYGYQETSTEVSVSGSPVEGVDLSLGIYGVSGTVRTQSGDPVAGQTVQVYAINQSHPDISSAPDPEQEAREALSSYAEAVPDTWDDTLQPESDIFSTAGSNYVAVTTEDVNDDGLYTEDDLSDPQIHVPANEEVKLTVWNPEKTGGIGGQNEWDEQQRGSIVDGKVVIEQVSAANDTISSTTVSTTEEVTSEGVPWIGEDNVDATYATASLNPGFYRVYPKGNKSTAYPIRAGSLEEAATASTSKLITPELEDASGQISEAAKPEADALANNKLVRKTTVTKGDGSFSVKLPKNVETVSVQVIGTEPGEYVDETTGETKVPKPPEKRVDWRSVEEWRSSATNESDPTTSLNTSSFYMSSQPKIVDVPSSGVDMRVIEVKAPGYTPVGEQVNKSEWKEDYLENLSYSDLPAGLLDNMSSVDSERLEELYSEMDNLTRENQRLEERVNELLAEKNSSLNESIELHVDAANATDAELLERISSIEAGLNQLEDTVAAGEGETTVSGETVSWSKPFETELSPESVLVRAHYTNGTTRVLSTDSQYVSINSRPGVGDEVVIRQLPLGEAAGAGIEVEVATEDGTGEARESFENPTYSGDMPGLDAVSLSTLQPGPRESVTATLRPSETAPFSEVESVSVRGPDGKQVPASVNGSETVRFTTNGSGTYRVATTFSTPNGKNHTLVQRLEAGGSSVDMPPTVRVKNTPFGELALVGDGLSGGEVDLSRGGTALSVVATVPNGEDAPDELEIHASEASVAPDATIEVRVGKGDAQKAVSKHVDTTIHLGGMNDGTLLYRNGEPLPDDSKLAEVERGVGSSRIETHTDDQGRLEIRKNADPSIFDRVGFIAATVGPDIESPIQLDPLANLDPLASASGLVGVPVLSLLVVGKRRGL